MKQVLYYRDHIPTFAEISAPLSNLLKKGKSQQVQWNEAQERAYSLLKEYLLQEPVLRLPDPMKPFILIIDASEVGVAAVLLQENKGMLYPVGYASKKLSLAEAKYPIIEKDCLALVKIPEGCCLPKDCVFRWAMAVQEYSFGVEYIPGKEKIGQISGAGLDILVNGQTFICKYISLFLWLNFNFILLMMLCL